MSDEFDLLEQRVTKHQKKLHQAASVVSMTRDRLTAAESVDKESQAELTAAEAALATAKAKVKELKRRAAAALELAEATSRERIDTERELTDDVQQHERRQGKLAKSESALASARAAQRVESAPTPPRKRAAAPRATSRAATKKSTTKKSATKKSATKKSATSRTTTTAKNTGTRPSRGRTTS